jgi:tRNA threonylcarbamoyladenosine modification (KEOPS) complex Cgi121 subunit
MGTLRIETNLQFASMRQIHAAIEHMERGDFECATTLADAAKCMLVDADKSHFLQLLNEVSRSHEIRAAGAVTVPNDSMNWVKHAGSSRLAKVRGGDHHRR